MFCVNCGATNPDDSSFCRACGQPLESAVQMAGQGGAAAAVLKDNYAGFWERFAAVILDGILLNLISFPLAFGIGLVMGIGGMTNDDLLTATGWAVSLTVSAAYFIVMESGEQGATFGKRLLKIRVLDVEGNRISKGRALGRWISHALSDITLGIGYLVQPFTAKKQALHDLASGTIVVRTGKDNGAGAVVAIVVGAFFFIVFVIGILAAIAIPAYQDYVAKAKVYHALDTGKAAAHAVEGYLNQTGRIPASIAETNINIPPNADISDILVNPETGEIQLVFSDSMPSTIAGKYINLTPSQADSGMITWKCGGNIRPSALPQQCR